MAEAFLQLLLNNLSTLIQGEIGKIMGVSDQAVRLSSSLTTIQAVLEDAQQKQLQDKAIRIWLRKLNDLSYEIDDVLDECANSFKSLEYHRKSRVVRNIFYKHKIGSRMQEVTEKLDAVVAERAKFHLRETAAVLQTKLPALRDTGSIMIESHHIYGRDVAKEEIIDVLVNKVTDCAELSILSVVGVGGLGKTTFAQLVFNDERVTEHFDVKLWVCVSDDFDPKNLIKAMIESATCSGSSSNLSHLDSLQHSLLRELNKKRYLLVLDDVWNEDQEKWSMLKGLMACGSAGSSIIVTTRLKKAADIMSTLPPYYLKELSEENCWLLFKQRAFGENEDGLTTLEAVGKQIVRKCGGVPLAAKALGGLLRFKRKEDDWIHVKESDLWNLPEEESSILPALRLSYHNLPLELRPCFAYCSLFPKDTWIEKDELVLHWIAHGYISSNKGREEEDIGDEICNELVLRSLFQDVRIHDNDGRVSFQMHDLVHDLAQSVMNNRVPGAKSECDDRQISDAKIRQVDLLRKSVAFPASTVLDLDFTSILQRFIRLRILDASATGIQEVPSAIENLQHVRYLNLSRTCIQTLPDTLCCLWNLKILNLNDCTLLERLPKDMRQLDKLRHLFLKHCFSLSDMPPNIGELTLLKTLSIFIVSRGKANQLGELEKLDLGGELRIQHLERVEDPAEAIKANLFGKPNLQKLSFIWDDDHSSQSKEVKDTDVLEALKPHSNVKNLSIQGFRGEKFPSWMESSSTRKNLFILVLGNCPNCSSLPQVLGDLPHLKELYLNNLAVEYIIEDEVQASDVMSPKFPSLQNLNLSNLRKLKGLYKEGTGAMFPNLQDLSAIECPSFTLPQLSSIRYLHCSSMVLPSFYKLDNLTTLWVVFDKNAISVPKEALQNLINLKSLTILHGNEQSLPEEGLQGLKSLTSFNIRNFRTLTSLPGRWLSSLTALESLKLHLCSNLVEIPDAIKCLNLTSLILSDLPKMTCLPDALQHLTSLQNLHLDSLSQLTSLPDWLCDLTSLDSMHIRRCPKLVSLPDSIGKLEKLRRLSIIECPELWKRCEKGRGEDWPKISHIPHLSNREEY